MSETWKLEGPERGAKSFFIVGPVISLEVDYDDVDHPRVLAEAKRVLALLNQQARVPLTYRCDTCGGSGKDDDGERVRDCPKTETRDGCPLCCRPYERGGGYRVR